MSRLLPIVLTVLVLPVTAHAASCAPHRHYRTILNTRQATVAQTTLHRAADGASWTTYRACWRPTGRSTVVGTAYSDDFSFYTFTGFTVTGHELGFVVSERDRDSQYTLEVFDLSRGRADGEGGGFGGVVGPVLLTASGSIAARAQPDGASASIVALKAGAPYATELDRGPAADIGALSLSGNTLTWSHAGEQHSATLP